MDYVHGEVQAVCELLADDEYGHHFLPINVQTDDGQEGLGLLFCVSSWLGTHRVLNRLLLGRDVRVTVLRPVAADCAVWGVRVLSTLQLSEGLYEHTVVFREHLSGPQRFAKPRPVATQRFSVPAVVQR